MSTTNFGKPPRRPPYKGVATESVYHQPRQATMTWQLEPDGTYVLLAAGVDGNGNRCEEKPQRFRPDGVAYPVDGFPGLTSVTTRPDRNTIRAEAKREDNSLPVKAPMP